MKTMVFNMNTRSCIKIYQVIKFCVCCFEIQVFIYFQEIKDFT